MVDIDNDGDDGDDGDDDDDDSGSETKHCAKCFFQIFKLFLTNSQWVKYDNIILQKRKRGDLPQIS